MHNCYRDLYERIPEAPLWFDEVGAPRYVPFSPLHAWNIYAREAVLMDIECQACGHAFSVCMTWSSEAPLSLAAAVREARIHYGDPPNVNCCDAGPTMNSVPKRVREFWNNGRVGYEAAMANVPKPPSEAHFREIYGKLDPLTRAGWDRVPELEIDVVPDWAR